MVTVDYCDATIALRALALVLIVVCFYIQCTTVVIFKFEQYLSSGALITFLIIDCAMLLAMIKECNMSRTVEIFYLGCGTILYTGIVIYLVYKWRELDELTEVMIELLQVLGQPLRRRNITKAICYACIAFIFTFDIFFAIYIQR